MSSELSLDAERQKQAKRYARINRRLMLLDLLLGGLYALSWLIFGWSVSLRNALLSITSNPWLLIPAFTLVFGGIYYLISLPLSYYSSYILPHRFDQSNQTRKGWIIDQVKGILLGATLGLIILEIIYAVLRQYPETWWVWAAGFLLVFNILLANIAPVLLLPIFYKFTPLSDQHVNLEQRLLSLANRADTRVRGVYQFDMSRRTKSANAALTGIGNTRRIILGDTLLNEFEGDEIETILAHELGHHVHKDIPIGILVESLITLIGLYIAALGLAYGVQMLDFFSPADVAAFPLLILVLGAFGLLTMPLTNAFSRWRERRADQFALDLTGMGEAYISALVRLADQNLADADQEPWVEWLLYSHPALIKRIAMAQAYQDSR
jgi:STE24 endopeptidase